MESPERNRYSFLSLTLLLPTVILIFYKRQHALLDYELQKEQIESRLADRHLRQMGLTESMRAFRIKHKYCGNGKECSIIAPFIQYESRQMIAPSYGISSCMIYKNFSTVMTSIMCYLFDALNYKEHVRNMMKDTYNVRLCKDSNEFDSFKVYDHIKPLDGGNWTHYIITREPMERFISGFVNKCLQEVGRPDPCYNCGDDIKCVMEKEYQSLKKIASGMRLGHTVEDAHFAPQSWFCDMRENYANYKYLKYSGNTTEEMLDGLFEDFDYLGVPTNITDDMRNQILGGRTFHATYSSKERRKYEKILLEDRSLRELLVKMFYYDYILFGYPLPQL